MRYVGALIPYAHGGVTTTGQRRVESNGPERGGAGHRPGAMTTQIIMSNAQSFFPSSRKFALKGRVFRPLKRPWPSTLQRGACVLALPRPLPLNLGHYSAPPKGD